jgi:glycerol uptake facilitator-like aquaporin
MTRSYLSEFIGTALLLATVVGSGIMADDLSGGITGLALLANAIATGAMLFVLITILGPISGAHFNPVVTLAMLFAGRITTPSAIVYIVVQIAGAILGVWLAHAMFNLDLLQISGKVRWGTGQWIAEATATFGLLLVIFGCLRHNSAAIPIAVALYITSAYWFTASTSFANPAVTVARALTNTFAGIAPSSAPTFIIAQVIGAFLGLVVVNILFAEDQL